MKELGYPLDRLTIAQNIRHFPDTLSAAFVAVSEEHIAGVVSVSILPEINTVGSTAKITSLIVRNDVRGAGAGRELVARAESHAWSHKCRFIWVSADAKPGTQTYYTALGYHRSENRMIKDNPVPNP